MDTRKLKKKKKRPPLTKDEFNKRNNKKSTNSWVLNNSVLNDHQIKKNFFFSKIQGKLMHHIPKLMRHNKSRAKRKVQSTK